MVRVIPHERVSERIVEHIVDGSVPQLRSSSSIALWRRAHQSCARTNAAATHKQTISSHQQPFGSGTKIRYRRSTLYIAGRNTEDSRKIYRALRRTEEKAIAVAVVSQAAAVNSFRGSASGGARGGSGGAWSSSTGGSTFLLIRGMTESSLIN